MQVSNQQNQHEVMIEAVENHMPEIIIIDEIGTELEAAAARTIAERGVQLVGTVHGNALDNLIKNPTISDLIGGIQYVTLGDEEAKRRGSSKSILERKAPPTFEIAIEIHDPKMWVIHESIENSVDLILQGQSLPIQKRSLIKAIPNFVDCKIVYNQKETGSATETFVKRSGLDKKQKNNYLLDRFTSNEKSKTKKLLKTNSAIKTQLKQEFTFVYIYGINNHDLKTLIKTLRLPIIITKEIQYADAILALANLVKSNRKLKQISHSKKITIHTIQSNSLVKIAKALRLLSKKKSLGPTTKATDNTKLVKLISREFLTPLEEARLAIEEVVIPNNVTIDLLPRNSELRKQQHELISHYHLKSFSVGKGKRRRIRIFSN